MPDNQTPGADEGVITIFHNPSCTKSRNALDTLEERSLRYERVDYVDAPPSRQTLELLVSLLVDPVHELIRTTDARFRALGLDPAAYKTSRAVVELLLVHPELMQRPILVHHDRAVIARSAAALDLILG